ncbi:hypothetical protein A0H81_10412 [Grifola frondosa]|uniref:Uncharacterized protein n=1 Tax=Grifola frondosa TaxID=5627 RepID=A0A1C7LYF9_GRIFR|nr:hypothetical protein A0H81_10412 [Grifola frondosa]
MTLFLVRDLLEAAVGLCGSTGHVPEQTVGGHARGHAGTLAGQLAVGQTGGDSARTTHSGARTRQRVHDRKGQACGRRAFAHGTYYDITRASGEFGVGEKLGDLEIGMAALTRGCPVSHQGWQDGRNKGVGPQYRLHSPVSTSTSSPSLCLHFHTGPRSCTVSSTVRVALVAELSDGLFPAATFCIMLSVSVPAVAVRHMPTLGPVYLRPSTGLGVGASADARGASSTLPSLFLAPYPPAFHHALAGRSAVRAVLQTSVLPRAPTMRRVAVA